MYETRVGRPHEPHADRRPVPSTFCAFRRNRSPAASNRLCRIIELHEKMNKRFVIPARRAILTSFSDCSTSSSCTTLFMTQNTEKYTEATLTFSYNCILTPICPSIACTSLMSCSETSVIATPPRPARAVRPTLHYHVM